MLPLLNIQQIRQDFPLLHQTVNGKPLIYLDNAATSQKPSRVIDTLVDFYRTSNANVHRSVHALSEEATRRYEQARQTIQHFIRAQEAKEIVFVRGATEGINLVAQSYGRTFLKAGDEIVITGLEHHSNIIPWRLLQEQIGIVIKTAPVNESGEVILERYYDLLSAKTKLVALNHVSNVLGTISPIQDMIAVAKSVGAVTLIDGCQAIPHLPVDVQRLGCDFYVFSSHKALGPTGIGVLYGRKSLLEAMPPYQGGGEMIREVLPDKTVYADLPYKFEAGTPNFADTIAFEAALQYLEGLGFPALMQYEETLQAYLTQRLSEVKGLRIVGQAARKIPIASFVIERTHPNDIGTLLDQLGIAVRVGHHCAMPLMHRYALPGTVRASLSFYNTREEIDQLVAGIERVKRILIDPDPVVPVSEPIAITEPPVTPKPLPVNPHPIDSELVKGEIIEVLRTIYDPEIPVNIYDLGLIYAIHVDPYGFVEVQMTLTAPGCPVAQTFPGEVQGKIAGVSGVVEAAVNLVWDPPWTQDKMSEAARLTLGLF